MSSRLNTVYVISKTILTNNNKNICSKDKELHKIIEMQVKPMQVVFHQ